MSGIHYDFVFGVEMNACNISEKEALELAWKYFQQHAQQRISFFNFFVVFSVLMTTGLLTTFQKEFDAHYIGIVIGLTLSLISFIFWKVDERNKYLTKHSENIIKKIESNYGVGMAEYRLFSLEESQTDELKSCQQYLSFHEKQISHSMSFNIIFTFFFLIGLIGSIASGYYQVVHNDSERGVNIFIQGLNIDDKETANLLENIDNMCKAAKSPSTE